MGFQDFKYAYLKETVPMSKIDMINSLNGTIDKKIVLIPIG